MRHARYLVFLLAGLSASLAHANNNYFLPGDAFFPTEVTADVLTKLQAAKPGEYEFRYSGFQSHGGFFCGYAGYSVAQIPAVDRPFVANLAKVYAKIRVAYRKEFVEFEEDGKTQRQETNGMRVLFYPEKFDFPRYKLGLQYNEKWVEEIVKFGHDAERIRLGELIDDKDAIIESWRDSTRVGTFAVEIPKLDLEPSRRVETPMIIKGDVKAIVIPPLPLQKFYKPAKTSLLSVYVVDAEGIQEYGVEFNEGQWSRVGRWKKVELLEDRINPDV